MKRKIMLLFILFYLLVYAVSGIHKDLYLIFVKYAPLEMPQTSWQYLLLDFVKSLVERISVTLTYWDLYKVTIWFGAGVIILFGAWIVGCIVGRSYDSVCSRLKELEAGDYAGVSEEKGIFSSLLKRLNSLSTWLAKELSRNKRQRQEERGNVGKALEEIQALAATIKGHAEVLAETPSIPKDGYEKQLLQQILQKTLDVERVAAKVENEMKYFIQSEAEKSEQ